MKWYDNKEEEMTILALMALGIVAMFVLTDANNVVSAIGGGLVGYLSRGNKVPNGDE